MPIAQIVVEGGRLVDLQDFRAQVGHGNAPLDGVGCIHRVLEHDVGIATLELDLGQRLEELAGVDLLLADALVTHHFVVFLGDRNFREGLAIDLFHVMWREQVHVGIALGQLEGHVRNHHAQRQRLDADLLVGILALGVQKAQDVRMVGIQVDRTGTLPRTQLVGIRERIFQQLHHRNHTGRLVLDALDGRTQLAQVGKHQRHAAAPLGKLQCRIDGTPDALHVVFHTQQEARDQFAPALLAGVEERGRGRLESTADDLVHEAQRQLLVAARQRQRHHHHAVLEALQITLAVARLQRVGGVVLEGAQEGGKAELPAVGLVPDMALEIARILVQHFGIVIAFVHQIAQLLIQVVEEHRVLVDVLQEVLARRTTIGLELDVPVRVVQVQHRVQRVVVQPRFIVIRHARIGGFVAACSRHVLSLHQSWVIGAFSPSSTLSFISNRVPVQSCPSWRTHGTFAHAAVPMTAQRSDRLDLIQTDLESLQAFTNPSHVQLGASQLEAVQHRHAALVADDIAGTRKQPAEIAVAAGNHTPQQAAAIRVVQEADHLPGHGAASFAIGVGGRDQHEGRVRLGHRGRLIHRNAHGRQPQLVHEALGVA